MSSKPPRSLLRAAACAVVSVALLGACGTDGPPPGVPVLVPIDEVQEAQNFYEGEYLGRRVLVSAEVTDVLDRRHLELGGADYGEDSLLVRTAEPHDVRQGMVVRVVGTVGQYHRFLESEGVPPVQYDMYEEYETEPYLYDAAVEVVGV